MRFTEDIKAGLFDDYLSQIEEAVKTRRRSKTLADFQIGDRVQFNNLVSPKYLTGVQGTVVGHKNTRVLVDFPSTGRFNGSGTKCPPSLLDKVAA